jgi:hypothetical protein
MKRLLIPGVALVIVSLFASPNAYAVCQTCRGMGPPTATCWTLTACERGANMSACVVGERTANGTTYQYCDSMGTTEGPECNGADPSCANTGGGGTPGGGTGGGTGGNCTVSGGETCPAQCSTCGTKNNDCFCG